MNNRVSKLPRYEGNSRVFEAIEFFGKDGKVTYKKGLIKTTVTSSRRKSSNRRTSFLPGEHTDSEHFGDNRVSRL